MTKEKVFISEADQYLLPRGPIMIFTKTGCTSVGGRRRAGSLFRVWAPNAAQVNVIGTFNEWNEGIPSHAEAGRRRYLGAVHSRRGRGNDV